MAYIFTSFFQQWIHTSRHPELRGSWSYDAASKRLEVTLNQTQDRLIDVEADLGILSDEKDAVKIETGTLDARENAFAIPLDRAPLSVELDPDLWLLMDGKIEKR